MSLARMASMDSNPSRQGSYSGRARDSRLTFNPVDRWAPAKDSAKPVAAFEVSKAKRLSQVSAAVLYCLLAAGIIFGYAAIKPVLIQEGVYRDRCSQDELDRKVRICYGQELRLNLMFAIAAATNNVGALPVGTLLDRYGPRMAGICGGVLVAMGCVTFAFAGQLPFDGYIPAYVFLSLGGPFIFLPAFQLSNTFPLHSGLILSILTGAFDSSTAVFLVYRLVYERSHGVFIPKYFFLAYLAVPLFIISAQIFLMPSKSYQTLGELTQQLGNDTDGHYASEADDDHEIHHEGRRDAATDLTKLLRSKAGARQAKAEERKRSISGVWGALHGRSAWRQIRSPFFILVTLFTMVQMTRINYFVATVRFQYEHLLGDYDAAVRINSFFDVALPLGGLAAIPFIGLILDNTSTPFVLGLLVLMGATIGVLGVLPYLWAGYANVVLFVMYRPFYYTAISDYAAKVFGFHTFGKVYGLAMCLSGIFNISQYGLDALTYKRFHEDPVPINVILLVVALVLGLMLVGYVGYKSRAMKRILLEEEAEEATEVLMPGATDGF